jgi:hypothetical protein
MLLQHKENVMRHFNMLKQTILAMGLMLTAFSANADKLDLSQGTMSTGGIIAFQIRPGTLADPTTLDEVSGADMGWAIDFQLGYFIMDNFSLDFDLTSRGTFTNPLSDTGVGLGLGAHYYLNLGSMINPYMAVLPNVEWNNGNGSESIWVFNLPISLGVLIGLNSHVALDVGARVNFGWGLSDDSFDGTAFDLTVGYVGIKAFF